MLDMGFLPAVRKLVERCPRDRQTLFFSATLPPELEKLSGWALPAEPGNHRDRERRSPAETVTHAFYPVNKGQKFDLLAALLAQNTDAGSILVFARTRHGADRIARKLKGLAGARGGPRAAAETVAVMHSDRSQNQRVAALEGFKSGKYPVMVATDIAARGIDVASVTHVVNFDIPRTPRTTCTASAAPAARSERAMPSRSSPRRTPTPPAPWRNTSARRSSVGTCKGSATTPSRKPRPRRQPPRGEAVGGGRRQGGGGGGGGGRWRR